MCMLLVICWGVVLFWHILHWMRSYSGWACWDVFFVLLGRRWSSSMLPKRGPQAQWMRFGTWRYNLVSFHTFSVRYMALELTYVSQMSCNIGADFLCYATAAVAVSLFLMIYCAPRYGQMNIMVYVGICSVIGSLTVNVLYEFVLMLSCRFVTNMTFARYVVLSGNEH